MKRNKEGNGIFFCNMEWNENKNVEWNGTVVGWYAECHCVISCAYSLTYDFHMGRVEWNYDLDIELNITVQSFIKISTKKHCFA